MDLRIDIATFSLSSKLFCLFFSFCSASAFAFCAASAFAFSAAC